MPERASWLWSRSAAGLVPWALLLGMQTGCAGEGEGRPDSELGNLVLSPPEAVLKVDLDASSRSGTAMLDALRLPHSWVSAQLGAHLVRGTSEVQVLEGAQVVEQLGDSLFLDIDGEDRFHVRLDNSKEYGRHAVFDGESLYLRPRFGRYHARAPQTEREASEIRDEVFAGAGDYLELVASRLEVSSRGTKPRHDRAVMEVALKLAPTVTELPAETLRQRGWRDTIEVLAIDGSVALDAETGVPLDVVFSAEIAFVRERRRFHMKLQVDRHITEIAHTRAITAPEASLVMRIPARRRELEERESLLESIAPPARKAPTPSKAAPL